MRTLSTALVAILMTALAALAQGDQDETSVVDWSTLQQQGKTLAGQIVPSETKGQAALRITNTDAAPKPVRLTNIEDLSPAGNTFALEGKVRYADVQGDAYLEMWVVFPDQSRYFTRTLADFGQMQKITGSADWRPFILPFRINGPLPEKVTLEVNAYMPGKGTIDITPLKLLNPMPENALLAGAWWSGQTAGWIGGGLGSLIGILAALVAFLIQKGASPLTLRSILAIELLLGLISTAIGLVALLASQPYHVYYPPLLIGILTCVLVAINEFKLRRHAREIELRKMHAMDAQ